MNLTPAVYIKREAHSKGIRRLPFNKQAHWQDILTNCILQADHSVTSLIIDAITLGTRKVSFNAC